MYIVLCSIHAVHQYVPHLIRHPHTLHKQQRMSEYLLCCAACIRITGSKCIYIYIIDCDICMYVCMYASYIMYVYVIYVCV
jgi:hypothetical protein